MRCAVCGREAMNPEANYCDYCGSSFRKYGQEGWSNQTTTKVGNNESGVSDSGYSAFGMSEYREPSQEKQGLGSVPAGEYKPVTTWTYLGVLLLPMVPWVGTIAWLVVMCYWAFSSNVDAARKHFARAYMIFMGISLVVLMSLLSVLMPT
ncbi:MAG: hypothetical protein IJW37_06240 [Lachnospiraceae bacterium]|nr:hypothetical protein [Lachnospiraceae bacterium]